MENEEFIKTAKILMDVFAKDTKIHKFAEAALLNVEKLEKYNMLDELLEVKKNDD